MCLCSECVQVLKEKLRDCYIREGVNHLQNCREVRKGEGSCHTGQSQRVAFLGDSIALRYQKLPSVRQAHNATFHLLSSHLKFISLIPLFLLLLSRCRDCSVASLPVAGQTLLLRRKATTVHQKELPIFPAYFDSRGSMSHLLDGVCQWS